MGKENKTTSSQVQVIDRFPRIFRRDEDFLKSFIREKVKEGLRDGFKDLMKEAFDELLGDKKVKEIQEERKQAEIEKQRQEEMKEFMDKLKDEVEYNKRNPQITTLEVAQMLDVSRHTVLLYIKRGWIKAEQDSFRTWYYRRNEIQAFKEQFSHLIKPRPEGRHKRERKIGCL